MSTREKHNGFNSYETWLTVCWIDNDEYLLEEVRGMDSSTMKEFIYDYIVGDERAPQGLTHDLLWSAYSEIDFDELAKHYDTEEEEEETEEDEPEN